MLSIEFKTVFPSTGFNIPTPCRYDLANPEDLGLAFDYNSTGRADHLIFYRPGRGAFVILEKGDGNQFQPIQFEGDPGHGIPGRDLTVEVGDSYPPTITFDLATPHDRLIAFDGKSTGMLNFLMAYRPGAGVVWIFTNQKGDLGFSVVYKADHGGIGGFDLADVHDKIFAFDYEGTGKLDHLALFRPGSGLIAIVKPYIRG